MSNPVQSTEEILKLIEKYGFKFFGNDESNNILVVAPNGQVIPIALAHKFVLDQIAKASAGAGGPESMPQMPSMPNTADSKIEKNFETEKGVENTKADPQAAQTHLKVQSKTPQAAVIAQPQKENPYGDGFKLSFNPASEPDKAEEFVKQNSNKSASTSLPWLSAQFEKFLAEQKAEMG